MKRISVVMVVYNGERFLREAVASVLAQTLRNFEFVIVDDGSTDSSLSILMEYARNDSRIVVVEAQHGGEAAARNLGMSRATHELIAVMDADDRMLPERLERQLWFFEQNRDASIVCSFAYMMDVRGIRIGSSSHRIDVAAGIRESNPSLFLEIVHPSVLAVKADLLSVGGYRNIPLPDRDLWGRLVTSGFKIRCQHEQLVEYRLHGGALSSGNGYRASELIDLNVIRRLRGEQEISREQFLEWRERQPLVRRLQSNLKDIAVKKYKRATRYYAERRWLRCAVGVTVAMIASPKWTLSRVVSGMVISKG